MLEQKVKSEVFEVFKRECLDPDSPLMNSTVDDWSISPYKDAHILGSGGARFSNRLYFIKNGKAFAFSPSLISVESAYEQFLQFMADGCQEGKE